jgi:hypothetical protein
VWSCRLRLTFRRNILPPSLRLWRNWAEISSVICAGSHVTRRKKTKIWRGGGSENGRLVIYSQNSNYPPENTTCIFRSATVIRS